MEDKNRNNPFGCSINTCFSIGCLFFVAFFVIFGILLFLRPQVVQKTLNNFLNDGIAPQEIDSNRSANEIQSEIQAQVSTVGENTVVISEEDLTILARRNLDQLEELSIDIEKDVLNLYWTVGEETAPLYLVAEIKHDEADNLYVNKLGTRRLYFPESINKFIVSTLLNGIKFDGVSNESIIYEILNANGSYTIKDIMLEDDEIKLIIEVNVSLF